jgi:hypothetical protein
MQYIKTENCKNFIYSNGQILERFEEYERVIEHTNGRLYAERMERDNQRPYDKRCTTKIA